VVKAIQLQQSMHLAKELCSPHGYTRLEDILMKDPDAVEEAVRMSAEMHPEDY
jgi:hypothetical protein